MVDPESKKLSVSVFFRGDKLTENRDRTLQWNNENGSSRHRLLEPEKAPLPLDSFYRLVAGLDLINFGFFLIYAIEHKPNPGLKAEKTNGENDSAVSSTLKRRK
ncbi:hypothetical protein WN944_000691 [Citrus x changshan-huyou]|uniref:Uncharacterized protein n=1 Tax=Citrus x changshan-huyou TaxID=2935761 RepID=A0AAP0MHU2_9ROSI